MNDTAPKPSLAARIAASFLRLYQLTLSPVLHAVFGVGSGCRFEPTCSCYGRQAFFKHGFFSGFGLTLRRLLRCHPWNPGGYDPVPDLKNEKRQDIGPSLKSHLDG